MRTAILPVNTPEQGSEKWVEFRGNETLHPSIEEIEDEDEWKNSSLNNSDIDDFNEIIIRYIGTDESLMNLWNRPWPDEEDFLLEISINATLSPSQEFVIKQDEGKEKQTVEEIVPLEYHEYLDVFQEEVVRFPKKQTWDHTIDMKNGFEPKAFRSYNLTLEEQHQQAEFIQENLKKGYIRLSKSPMASPFFFVSHSFLFFSFISLSEGSWCSRTRHTSGSLTSRTNVKKWLMFVLESESCLNMIVVLRKSNLPPCRDQWPPSSRATACVPWKQIELSAEFWAPGLVKKIQSEWIGQELVGETYYWTNCWPLSPEP